jgi:hypothetical protein
MGAAYRSPGRRRCRVHPGICSLLRLLLRCWLLLLPPLGPRTAHAAEPSRLEIAEVRREEGRIALYMRPSHLFDSPTQEALQAGLPVTLALRWQLLELQRSAPAATGGLWFRVLFDVLDGRYELFDDRGRHLATCATLERVQETLAERPFLLLSREPRAVPRLRPERIYRVELELRLVPLATGEIDDLERWLRGIPEREESRPGSLGISRFAVAWMRRAVGLKERSLHARSASFSG